MPSIGARISAFAISCLSDASSISDFAISACATLMTSGAIAGFKNREIGLQGSELFRQAATFGCRHFRQRR